MNDIAIRVEKLSKLYHIGKAQQRHDTLRDALADAFKRSNVHHSSEDELWALKDVSFEVKRGEVLGIIGRNGAGKSTLLKILSRITEPTSGRAEIHGRVGSLLEVGTGFHPELTGRENIYLNGAILGMHRHEIARKFDEIVAFAEIEKFLDTPVKRYSSGMYVRLAFAVAAHLEPEILLVDEVLAVGDAAFQKKCLGKMNDVAYHGRTVFFVSHQMNAIRALCTKSILLASGGIRAFADSEDVITQYLQSDSVGSEWIADNNKPLASNHYFNLTRVAVVDRTLRPLTGDMGGDEDIGVLIEGTSAALDAALKVGFAIYSSSGDLLFMSLHTDTPPELWPKIKIGNNKLICWVPAHLLNEGKYRVDVHLSLHNREWLSQPGVNAPGVSFGISGRLSESSYWIMARPGSFAPILPFTSLA